MLALMSDKSFMARIAVALLITCSECLIDFSQRFAIELIGIMKATEVVVETTEIVAIVVVNVCTDTMRIW